MARKRKQTSRENLMRQAASGRSSLLLVLIFSVVNIIMVLLDTDTYFLFSASVPYYLTMLGKGMDNGFVNGSWDVNGTYTITALVISAVILAVFLLCWIFSKKRSGWLTAAAVLFVLDTLALAVFTFSLYDSPVGNIMDFIFHIWVIASLIHGAVASKKLKKLPAEETAKIQNIMDGIPVLGEDSEDLF